MKNLINKITLLFKAPAELSAANRYIDYMKEELEILRVSLDNSVAQLGEMSKEVDRSALREDSLRNVAKNLRTRLYSHGCTDLEIKFLRVCDDINRKGKMISELRFKSMVAEMADQRQQACINRFNPKAAHDEESETWWLS
ncbi:hypothetical protein [Lelliottia wanjuensis]|uniref:hypothetical protein n=1 Tax=Lelliottia wanjuensis TaxID=3050585 RepID=UPI0025500351|nr:hypothetical protein [Lelliottia sp. V86_10]MDK9586715.1 hypothetical protein [Lelliottia sp. V86_10]